MMCECYKIGGSFIAEDPECPVHGHAAVREREEQDRVRRSLEDRVAILEEQVAMIAGMLAWTEEEQMR
jgi:hypothetical protein